MEKIILDMGQELPKDTFGAAQGDAAPEPEEEESK